MLFDIISMYVNLFTTKRTQHLNYQHTSQDCRSGGRDKSWISQTYRRRIDVSCDDTRTTGRQHATQLHTSRNHAYTHPHSKRLQGGGRAPCTSICHHYICMQIAAKKRFRQNKAAQSQHQKVRSFCFHSAVRSSITKYSSYWTRAKVNIYLEINK